MPTALAVHLLPSLVEPTDLTGGIAIVIDILRASTTITQALASGARRVVPCLEVADALAWNDPTETQPPLRGGERHGVKIDGFDFGNSPGEYTPAAVAGRTVVFTTTNGTRALHRCHLAERIFIGCFTNGPALLRQLPHDRPWHLMCAGTNGQITREDVLFAGWVVDQACQSSANLPLNDSALLAWGAWRSTAELATARGEVMGAAPADRTALGHVLRDTQGGRNLIRLGLAADIDRVAQLETQTCVPEWHRGPNEILSD